MKLEILFNRKRSVVLFTSLLAILIIILGYSYYKYEEGIIRTSKEKELESIGKLKCDQISDWYYDQLMDIESISKNIFLLEKIDEWLKLKNSSNEKKLSQFLSSLIEEHDLKNIFLATSDKRILFSNDMKINDLDSIQVLKIDEAITNNKTVSSDLFIDSRNNEITLNFISPILNEYNNLKIAFVIEIDPSKFLFPLIQSWPVDSKTSETFLYRVEKDSIIFLNELKHKKGTALKFKIALSESEKLTVMGAHAKTGIVEGLDYEGNNVLAVIVPINNTPWLLIAKVDKDEIFKELHYRGLIIFLISLISILLFGSILSFFYKYKQSGIFKGLFLKEKELRENIELFKTTLYSIGDAVITTDAYGRVKHMNKVAEQLTGWKEIQAINKSIELVFNIIDEEFRRKVESPVDRVFKEGIIIGLANHTLLVSKNGKETPIADSGAPIFDDNEKIIGVVLVFRDKTVENNSMKQLEESRNLLLQSQKVARLGSYSWDITTGLWTSSEIMDEIFGIDESYVRSLEGWGNIIHPEWRDELKSYVVNEVIGKKQKFDKEYKIKRINDGKERWVHGIGELEFDKSNNPIKLFGTITDINERKIYESQLFESEKRFRLMFENSPLSYQSLNSNAELIDVNPTWLSMLGYERDEVIGHHFSEFMTPKSAELIKTRLPYFIDKGEIHNFEFEMVRKDGEHLFVSYEGKIGYDEFGKFKQTHCIWTDITERKIAQEKLKRSEEDYKLLFNQTHDPIFVFLPEGEIILDVNIRACEVYGYSKEEFIGMSLEKISKNIEAGKLKITKVLADGSFQGFETIQLKKDGSEIIVEVNANKINYQNKKAILSVNRDLTERKKIEKEIIENEDRMRLIVEGTPYLFFYTQDTKGNITYISPSVEKITGRPAKDWLNTSHWFVTDSEINNEAVKRTHAHLNGEITEGAIYVEVSHADGYNIFLEVYENPVTIDGKVVALQGVAHDISEKIKAEKHIKESEELFRKAFISSPDAVSIAALEEGTYVNINEGFIQITGFSEEEILGKNSLELNIWADPNERDDLVNRLKEFGSFQNLEVKFKIKNGEFIYGLVSASVINIKGKPHILSLTRDITEIKKVEESLIQSEEKYRIVADNTTDWIYWIDQNKEFKYISPSVNNITGYSQFDFKSNPNLLTDIIVGADRVKIGSHFDNISEENESVCTLEFRIITKKGNIKWIYHRCKEVKDRNGNFLGRRSSNRDITELKEVEFQLKESEQKYRSFFEDDLTGDFISNIDGKLISCNKAFAEIFGFKSIEEALNYNNSKLYINKKSRENFLQLLTDKKILTNYESEYQKVTGEKIFLIENSIGIFNDFGELTGIRGYLFDNTDRKIAELQLKESEERYKGLFENAKLGIYRGTSEGELLYTNKAFADMLGYNSIEDLNKIKATELYVNIEDRDRFNREMQTIGFVSGFEELLYKNDNSIIVVSESARAIKDDNGNIIYYEGILEDISEKKENVNIIKMQSDLLYKLQSETEIDKILDITVSSIVSINPFDSCGIYIFEDKGLVLKSSLGLSEEFINKIKFIDKDSYQYKILEKKEIIFSDFTKLDIPAVDPSFKEGLRQLALIPLISENKLFGCINAAVHNEKQFSQSVKNALISIGSILAEIISRINVFNELQLSEEKFRLVFENEINGFAYHEIITDNDGKPFDYRFINVNKGFERIVQKKAEDIIGKTVLEIWPETESNWIEKYGDVALNQTSISFENYSAPLGKYFQVNAYSPVKGFFAVSFNDITLRVEHEQNIRKLQRAVEQSQVSIEITDVDGKIEYVNPKFEEVTGYTMEEILGKNPKILKSGKIGKEFYAKMWEDLSAGKDWNGLFYNKRKNGELFWESANISPITDSDGKITNYIAVKEDITEKVKSENELKQYKLHLENLVDERTSQLKDINIKLADEIRKQREIDKKLQAQLYMLTTFVESIPTAAFIKNSELKFIEVNHAFEEMAGKKKEEIIGKTALEVFPKETAELMNDLDKEIIKQKNLKTFDLTLRDQNNIEKYFIVKKTTFENAEGNFGGVLGTYIDFSEQKKLQDGIEKNLAAEKDLNELKSRFISMASHEFRTPLTSIRIFSDLITMQKDKNDKEKLAEYTEKIQNSVTYMTELINDVLTVSRVETGKLKFEPENVDVKSFFEDIINEIKLTSEVNHNLILNFNSRKKVTFIDAKLLKYVVANLLSNAVKYSPDGGDIVTTIEIEKATLVISVKDSGIGVSDVVMRNLFEPFLRGDNIGAVQGTGLGLSIVKKAVDLHKGEITCSTEINKGTTFTVTIPII